MDGQGAGGGAARALGGGHDSGVVLRPFRWEGGLLVLLDQRRLPDEERWLPCDSPEAVAAAIRDLVVRGAPAIGIAAAYGLALAARRAAGEGTDVLDALDAAAVRLTAARPTAVNLRWAVERVLRRTRAAAAAGSAGPDLARAVEAEAEAIADEDLAMNRAIGEHGAHLLPDGGVLTYCNTGALATGGHGTALGMIRSAWRRGRRLHVYACETRPVLQGARLTAWELLREGIPATLVVDAAAGWLMRQGRVQAVVVGADRIAANGDVANKIGTYTLAVLARAHGIPFYVAAPRSTVDLATPSGEAIPIEERSPEEVTYVRGVRVAPADAAVENPAFDVTPAELVTAIVTDAGVARWPYGESLPRLATMAAEGWPSGLRRRS